MPSYFPPTGHRPWALPSRPWSMLMRWSELAFLHWPVPADILRPLIPQKLTLETFGGAAWLGVVPFQMQKTRYRWAPRIPTATNFPETNVRTYVHGGGRSGVWFFSLDAASRLAVWGARRMLNLPYFHASMQMQFDRDGVRYSSERTGDRNAGFCGTYRATGPVFEAKPGTLEYWLTERYCLFGQRRSGLVYYLEVHHAPWPLQPGAVVLERNTLPQAAGVPLPDAAPLVHVAQRLDVWGWSPVAVE